MEKLRATRAYFFLLVSLLCHNLDLCAALNDEGRALLRFREKIAVDPYGALLNWNERDYDPCAWFGVECSADGRVVALDLKDLLLEGALAGELGKLVHLKSLILHNNSFCGTIPKEFGELRKLEVLDLGYNNFSGPYPSDISGISSLEILVLRNNSYIDCISSELHDLSVHSELLVDEGRPSSEKSHGTSKTEHATIRRFLQESKHKHNNHKHQYLDAAAPASAPSPKAAPSLFRSSPLASPSGSPSSESIPPPSTHSPANQGSLGHIQSATNQHSPEHTPPSTNQNYPDHLLKSARPSESKRHIHLIVFLLVAGSCFLLALSVIYCLCCQAEKVVTVMPWKTGLSGQLQKAFVTGVPSLRRSELESSCEDFSNVVGTLSDCYLYKGTLSSGVEIAVTSSMVTSAKDWSDHYEVQFRKKISVLSLVNHKNFMNLIGYCEEEEPFTRMMVYEYTPNGTLFEHLHIKEADHLDWAARLRIIMGIAYCLEHIHQLNPPAIFKNLNSSSIYLSDDYAAKVSDLSFCSKETETDQSFESSGLLDAQLSTQEGNVYKFGIILLEIISGRLPFSEDDGLLVLWASSHLSGKRPLMDMVDTTLESFTEEDVIALSKVIKACIKPDPRKRPTMAEVVARLRQITGISPEAASPKLSPLWWAELEIISTESNSLL